MVKRTLTLTDIVIILNKLADDLESHTEELRQLDAVIGDGDLGVTIKLCSKAVREYLVSVSESNIGSLLVKCGLSINKATPSTFGTLLASAFIGAGKVVMSKESINSRDMVYMAEGAIDSIKKRGKAELGDKTMLDCLIPAAETFRRQVEGNSALKKVLEETVSAADQGVKATVQMMSKHGRASWHRENTIGVQDAGATAMYYIIESFTRHLQE